MPLLTGQVSTWRIVGPVRSTLQCKPSNVTSVQSTVKVTTACWFAELVRVGLGSQSNIFYNVGAQPCCTGRGYRPKISGAISQVWRLAKDGAS